MLANKKLMTNYSIKNTEAAIIFEDRNDTGEDIIACYTNGFYILEAHSPHSTAQLGIFDNIGDLMSYLNEVDIEDIQYRLNFGGCEY